MYTRTRTLAAIVGIRPHNGPARRDGAGDGPGSGSATGGGGTGDSTTGGEGSDGKAGSGDGTSTGTPNIDGDLDKERAARAIQSAREAEKKAKEAAKAANDRVAQILKAAGLTPDGKEDPAEQLAASKAAAEQATQRARDAAVELAVYKAAGKAGADAEALLDSRGFNAAVKDLDPTEADFADKVTAAIKAAVKNNPKLAASTSIVGTGKQGADHTGGNGGTVTQKQFDGMNMAQRSELYRTNPNLYKQLAG